MIHLVVVNLKIGSIVMVAYNYFKEIYRFREEGIVNYSTIIKILERIGIESFFIIICIYQAKYNPKN
jgi:hypothetical protein